MGLINRDQMVSTIETLDEYLEKEPFLHGPKDFTSNLARAHLEYIRILIDGENEWLEQKNEENVVAVFGRLASMSDNPVLKNLMASERNSEEEFYQDCYELMKAIAWVKFANIAMPSSSDHEWFGSVRFIDVQERYFRQALKMHKQQKDRWSRPRQYFHYSIVLPIKHMCAKAKVWCKHFKEVKWWRVKYKTKFFFRRMKWSTIGMLTAREG